MELTDKNVKKLMKSIRKGLSQNKFVEETFRGFLIKEYYPIVNKKRYKGKGRPRKTDYDYVHYRDFFKGNGFQKRET